MKRTGLIFLTLPWLALAACANDKPASDASGQTQTTSAVAPEPASTTTPATDAPTMSAPAMESPKPASLQSSKPTTPRADTAVPAHDVNKSADASSTNGTYSNSGGAPGAQTQPGVIAPPPLPQNNSPSVTPMDQGNSQSDLKITQAIRKEVVANSDLSFTAKNVKIITQGGHVTLKGEVKTQKERESIAGTAIRVVGATNVDDLIVVKP